MWLLLCGFGSAMAALCWQLHSTILAKSIQLRAGKSSQQQGRQNQLCRRPERLLLLFKAILLASGMPCMFMSPVAACGHNASLPLSQMGECVMAGMHQ